MFESEIAALAEQSKLAVNKHSNERATENYVILPFITALGYNISNPEEVEPEFSADVGIKKGEKVDYALKISNEPIIIIEIKAVTESLNSHHHSQLFRYFTSTDVRIAILTNGKEAWFYSDLNKPNVMDNDPFFKFNFQNNTLEERKFLENFHHDKFEIDKIIEEACMLKDLRKVKSYIHDNVINPSNEFIRFIEMNSGISKRDTIEPLKASIKSAFDDYFQNKHNIRHTNFNPSNQSKNNNTTSLSYSTPIEESLEDYKILNDFRFLCSDPARTIFEKFITELKKLKVNLNTIPTYIQCFKIENHITMNKPFISIVPRKQSIKIGLAIEDKSEIYDPKNLCENRYSQNKHGIGNVLITVDEIRVNNHLNDIMQIVQQVYDKQGNSTNITERQYEKQDTDKKIPNRRDEAWHELNRNYWSNFKNYLAIESDEIKLGNPTKWTNQHFKSWRNNTFVLRVNAYDKHIAVSFHVLSESEEVNQKISDYLREKEDSFKSKIDGEYEWKPAQGKNKFSIILRKDADISTQNPEIKNSQFLWLKENLELFYNIFYPLTNGVNFE